MRTTSELRAGLVAAIAVFLSTSVGIFVLESRCEDATNRLRRSNLSFYGFHDSEDKTRIVAEKLVLDVCSKHLGVNLDVNVVERTHRLGCCNNNKLRPIIVKFTSTKFKDSILSAAYKLKGASYSISDGFPPAVRVVCRRLLAFAEV